MDPDSRSLIIVVFLFIAAAYFALTETAIASVSKNKIKASAERGNVKAKRVLNILDNFEEAITTLLICTNIAHISAASLVTAYVTRKWGLSAVTASTFIVTIAMFFFGEMLPKSIGKKMSEQCSLLCGGLLSLLMKICKPFSFILGGIGKLTLKLSKAEDEVSVTEDELYDIIEDYTEEGSIDEETSDLISSALSFGDVTVSSILTPRVDISGIDVNASPEEALEFIKGQNHSRVVVYDKTMDNVVGVLRIRKFLKLYISDKKIPDVKELMDPIYYAHQSIPIDELLSDMSKNKLNMAVVLDAYGGTLGIVTVEDILEEIVGEIWDEDDVIKEPLIKLTDNVFLARCDETVVSVFDFIGFEDYEEDEEERFTNLLMSDWIYEQTGSVSKRGTAFTYHNLKITVSELEHNRIISATVTVSPVVEQEEKQ